MIKVDKNKLRNILLVLIPLAVTLFFYLVILLTIDRGTSCDEGFYLLSYLPNQPLGSGISQFSYIVRFLGLPFDDNALFLRYLRYVLSFVSLLFFAITSYRYLFIRFKSTLNRYLYITLIMLAGVLAYTFASPVLYYDNIQSILYFVVFGLLFSTIESKTLYGPLYHSISGFLIVFSIFNYLPSGILLLFFYFIVFILYRKNEVRNKLIGSFLLLIAGLIVGLFFYHYFIHNLAHTFQLIFNSFNRAQAGITSHDNGSLILKALTYVVELLAVFTVFLIVGFIYWFLYKKFSTIPLIFWIIQFLFASIFLLFLTQRNLFTTYYSHLIILPISFLLAEIILSKSKLSVIEFKDIFLVLIFLFVPLAGVFGTNQLLSAKVVFFIPFWVLLFALVFSLYCKKETSKRITIYLVIWLGVIVMSYIHLGYFTRYHYYFTPTSSKFELSWNERFKSIKVSEWQKEFNEKTFDILKNNGFSKGDKILAFYDNFITVYAVGAYIPQQLVYQFEVFAADSKNIPVEKLDYILIIQEQEKPMIHFLRNTSWDFPTGYERFDLGKAAPNLPDDGYNSILFISKRTNSENKILN